MSAALTALQLLALVAVLLGVALLLPPGGALVVDGVLVLAAATALEVVRLRASKTPGPRRSGIVKPGSA